MVLGVLTGWLDRREREAIAYLIEENRLLRRQLGGRRLRLTDEDRPSGPLVIKMTSRVGRRPRLEARYALPRSIRNAEICRTVKASGLLRQLSLPLNARVS
jgi:hypothetical protein